jgi:hypothetical protein
VSAIKGKGNKEKHYRQMIRETNKGEKKINDRR